MEANNTAAMREAMEFVAHMDDFPYTTYDVLVAIQKARAALSATPRNCDRFFEETESMIAFLNEVWLISVKDLKECPFYEWTPLMKERYAKWLMEKEGGAK